MNDGGNYDVPDLFPERQSFNHMKLQFNEIADKICGVDVAGAETAHYGLTSLQRTIFGEATREIF